MKLLNKMKELKIIQSFKYKTMSLYCFNCKKNTESINLRVSKTSNGKTMSSSRFIKNQETSGLLHSLVIKTPLCKIPLLGNFFVLIVLMHCHNDLIVVMKILPY